MTSFPLIHLRELPEPGRVQARLTMDSNALGFEPQRVLFLWPFARPTNLRAQVIGHGWVLIGPVHLLLRPGWGLMRWVQHTVDEVEAGLRVLSDEPGRHKPPNLRFGDGLWRAYEGYPVHPLTVDGSIWQEVFDLMVDRCGFFVADLTARRGAEGLGFELSYLASWVHPSRQILLVDEAQADVDFCLAFLEDRWDARHAESPFFDAALPPVFLYDSQDSHYVRRVFKGVLDGNSSIPIATKAMSYMLGH